MAILSLLTSCGVTGVLVSPGPGFLVGSTGATTGFCFQTATSVMSFVTGVPKS